ncbi:hypothetical protein H2201_004602 [Coniosporium apollinis]|uniref:RING-type E3 ubiquitin transferase n=1 Tax=Coniosporium apollinis TaxID=61459 RepID=A0ABQ9NSD0_9PEZI|nr:hypothetical protein H2201_004602 [Coniosporium apollinis]
MANPRVIFIIVLLLFLLFSPDPQQPSLGQQFELDQILGRERVALDVLSSSKYGDFDALNGTRNLNLTGLRSEYGYAWGLLDKVKDRAKEQVAGVLGNVGLGVLNGTAEEELPLYRNVTGYIGGKWARSKVAEGLLTPQLKLSAVAPEGTYVTQEYNRNLTGHEGKVRLKFREKERAVKASNDSVKDISATLTIWDDESYGDWWEMALHGVHFRDFGGMLLTSTSEKFAGIFALPHFALSNHTYAQAQQVLNETLRETIQKQATSLNANTNPWSSSPQGAGEGLFSVPHCEYIVWLQQHPLPFRSQTKAAGEKDPYHLEMLEHELRFPTGYPFLAAPQMTMSMVAFSPDCGFVIESKGPPNYAPQEGLHLQGPKLESLIKAGRIHILFFACLLGGQIMLLVRQMKEASTPSTRSRISFYTIAIQAMGDGFVQLAFISVPLFAEATSLTMLATAFFAFLSVTFFGMRFLMDIWTVQSTERRRQERQQATSARSNTATPPNGQSNAQATPAPASVITAAGADTLPLPVTAARAVSSGATPIILPSDQDELDTAETNPTTADAGGNPTRRELGALYTRFYLILFGTVILSVHATSWPIPLRSAYTNLMSFLYFSFWIPQIYRNVMRNCRKALRWEFVVGQSVLRLLPFAYFYGVRDNVLFVENDRHALLGLLGWVWLQVLALVSQELLGPRFFVREGWAPPAYDYHPVLREDEEGASLPIGFAQAGDEEPGSPPAASKPGESRDKGKRVYDCAICMHTIEVPIVPAGGVAADGSAGMGAGLLARRAYMVTPCRHIFHSPCLEGWMRYRLQCPICREVLPPL